jgi:hypothetical protein
MFRNWLTDLFALKIGRSDLTGLTCGPHRSDRCCQSSQNTIQTSSLDRSCRVDQDSYVERPNRSPDERYMPSGRSARPASHTGLTGLTGALESEPK